MYLLYGLSEDAAPELLEIDMTVYWKHRLFRK